MEMGEARRTEIRIPEEEREERKKVWERDVREGKREGRKMLGEGEREKDSMKMEIERDVREGNGKGERCWEREERKKKVWEERDIRERGRGKGERC